MLSKGEVACFEQFLLLSPCFQNAFCRRGVGKCLYEGKGIYFNTYMQLLLLAVVRLAKARVDISLTSPLSELTILIKGFIPSEIKTGHINW